MTKFKDVAHLYIGCKAHNTFNDFYLDFTPVELYRYTHNGGIYQIKPILRPLSDITEDECGIELSEILGLFTSGHLIKALQEGNKYVIDVRSSFSLTLYLLSKHFDLFDLIKSGEAIDAATINPKT